MSLYTIDREIQATIDNLYNRVDENGELIDVTADDLKVIEQLNAERQTKLENIALYIKNLTADAAAIEAEIENLNNRKKRIERKCEGLKGLLLNSMIANNDTELSSPRYTAKIRSSETTEIDDLNLIPKEYIKEVIKDPEYKPDKKAIKNAIKAGQEVAGARIQVNKKVVIE